MDIGKVASGVGLGALAPGLAIGSGGMLLDQYWNYKNYQMQKEQYQYEKGLQKTIFSREDNATQRRIADLRAAGLSPVLAAGSPAGAGAVVSTQAPQIGKFGLDEKVAGLIGMIKMDADISRTNAEIELLNTQMKQIDQMLPVNIEQAQATTRHQNASAYKTYQEGREAEVDADTVKTSHTPNRGLLGNVYNTITGVVNRARSGLGLQPRHIQQQNINNQRIIPPRGATGVNTNRPNMYHRSR